MTLLQEKLDAKAKKRSNLFNWRGQFTPEFVEYILQKFAKEGDFVCDPFSGSGTVLLEAARQDIKAVGFEVNPAAYTMSRFFTFCNRTQEERTQFCQEFKALLTPQLNKIKNEALFVLDIDYRTSYTNLLRFASKIKEKITGEDQQIFLLNILFQSEKDKTLLLKDSIIKSYNYLENALLQLPYTQYPIEAFLEDAKSTGLMYERKVDLIVTSPPYINVFNYHQNYRAIIEEFDFDILKVAHSEFGSNRKNRGNRFKTVIQYCIDMEVALKSFWSALNETGKIVLILGRESNVRGTAFYNGQLIMEILKISKGFTKIQTMERAFINKFGVHIKEDIIVAYKSSTDLNDEMEGRNIAVKHLKRNLMKANPEIKLDIADAIENCESVLPSPLFHSKNVVIK